MATPFWSPGTTYQPGAIVQRRTAPVVVISAPENADLDSLTGGWTFSNPILGIYDAAAVGIPPFNGPNCIAMGAGAGTYAMINDNAVPVSPGQVITGGCYVNTTGQTSLSVQGGYPILRWYDSLMAVISDVQIGGVIRRTNQGWQGTGGSGTAPAGAAFCAIGAYVYRNSGGYGLGVDAFSWDYSYSAPPDGLLFRAVQALAGVSANIEPIWPTALAATVVDNTVTWEAVQTSRVVWEATPILVSGGTEPDWPSLVGSTVIDNTIAWEATSRRVTDPKCPQSKIVIIGASKIFAADGDIIAFSATVNPLDWSTQNDAGYIPFGLQTYGSNPVAAMGLYRSNLVAFNASGFQMWQIDQDPASMAILDAVPVPCTYHKSLQPVQNDLVMLTSLGFRNIGIAGASTNLQAGSFGKDIDPLVIEKIKQGDTARGLYFPAQGQYWCFFGAEAFVLTINGGNSDMSWTRYEFPSTIDNWTILDNTLYLRSGDVVWSIDADALKDDMLNPIVEFTSGFGTGFQYVGYDPFHGLGSTDSSDLTTHTILLAAYNLASVNQASFEFYMSGIFGVQEAFKTLKIYSGNFATGATLLATLDASDAQFTSPGSILLDSVIYTGVGSYVWETGSNLLDGVADFTIVLEKFTSEAQGTDFSGYLAWEYLPMGKNGGNKMMYGFDLSGKGEVAISFGYNQGDFSQATTPYLTDCESLVGPPTPMPLTAPSVQMRLTFSPNQAWEWEAALIYNKPLSGQS